MTNENDKATQALDDFWRKVERWREAICISNNEEAALAIAYDVWMDLRDPPGDPHKEWVDAEKMKPDLAVYPVLVKTKGLFYPSMGQWWASASRWEVQPMAGTSQYVAESEVTHWRYIPQEDYNG